MDQLCDEGSRIDPRLKARLLAVVRACAKEQGQVQAHRARLAEQAGVIPNFGVFRELCLEDLAEAYREDRQHGARAQKNRRRVWLNLFKPFARLHGIQKRLAIRAIDRGGHYRCELAAPQVPDHWEQWFRLGQRLGIAEAEMLRLWRAAPGAARAHEARLSAEAAH